MPILVNIHKNSYIWYIENNMNDLGWIEDIDGISSDVDWDVKSKWYSKRLNKKFKNAIIKWIHPTEMIKIKRVTGIIDRRGGCCRWLYVLIHTSVGNIIITNSIMGDDMYYFDVYNIDGTKTYTHLVHGNMTPIMLTDYISLTLEMRDGGGVFNVINRF